MNISQHFTLEEFLRTSHTDITENQTPPQSVIDAGTALATNVLDKVRDLVGVPVMISSGYRCPRLNAQEGGMPNSQHLTGEAADIYAQGYAPADLYRKIKASPIVFDEMIIEHDKAGDEWVHISWSSVHEQRGVCYKGIKQPEGGTICVPDGQGAFKG